MSFYNTTNETEPQLKRRTRRANSQYALIHEFFEAHPRGIYSPSQVWIALFERNELGKKKVPLTSVRRAMTDLTEDLVLEKTGQKQTGYYGDPEHLWRLRPKREKGVQQELF